MDNPLKKFGSIAYLLSLPNKSTCTRAELSATCQSRTTQDVYHVGLRHSTAHLPGFLFPCASPRTAASPHCTWQMVRERTTNRRRRATSPLRKGWELTQMSLTPLSVPRFPAEVIGSWMSKWEERSLPASLVSERSPLEARRSAKAFLRSRVNRKSCSLAG